MNPFYFRVQELKRQVTALSRYSDSSDGQSEPQSRRHCTSLGITRVTLTYRVISLRATVRHFANYKQLLEGEESMLKAFDNRREMYEKAMESFAQSLLDQRRQKSLQLSINLRKRRLEELRNARLLALREEKEKQVNEVKDNRARDERKKKEREEKSLSKVRRVADRRNLSLNIPFLSGPRKELEEDNSRREGCR